MTICHDLDSIIKEHLPNILRLRDQKELKIDNSFVSQGDLLCQKLIVDFFVGLEEKFTVISEEMSFSRTDYEESKNFAVVDPIDGTENFISGLKEWGISVSIYKGGRHWESMITLPELGVRLITGETPPRFHSRICGLSSSLTKDDLFRITPGFEYRIMGCAVYNLYNVICGSFATFENFKGAHSWDILAGLNLALEHNLEVTVDGKTYDGRFLQPDRKYLFQVRHR